MKKLAASFLFLALFANAAGCVVRARPGVYYAPQPRYVQPVYVQQPTVYVQPRPVYAPPPPVVQGTVIVR